MPDGTGKATGSRFAHRARCEYLTLDELQSLPTLCVGQADDLKWEDGQTRVWLSRCGVEDGEPFDNAVTVEILTEDGWRDHRQYSASTTNVHAWADGFGVWHIRVITNGSVGSEDQATDMARERLYDELGQRGAFSKDAVNVSLDQRVSENGTLTFYFTESNTNEGRSGSHNG